MILHPLEICQPVLAIRASKVSSAGFPQATTTKRRRQIGEIGILCHGRTNYLYKESFAPDAVGVAMQPKSGCKILEGY